MKRIIKSLLFLIISLPIFGQSDDVERLMTRRYLSCADILYNVSYLIPEYYGKGNKDTLRAILEYWEDRCGVSEELVRCKIILSIDDGSFNESLYDNGIFRMLRNYERNSTLYDGKDVQWHYYGYRYDNQYINRLNKFTVKLSKTLLETKELSAVERFFIRIYANDFDQPLFQMLDSDELNETKIKELYKEKNKSGYFHNDWILGVWIPQGNLDILGVHPSFGYRLGVKYQKLTADLSLIFQFVNSPNTYQVYKNGILWDTNNFLGGYIGLDAGYELFRLKGNSIDLIGGIAFNGFDTINEEIEGEKNNLTKSINSLNLNIGLGYKFHFKNQRSNQRYVGIDFKYNFVNFKNPHGTNLEGNTYTVNLLIGNVIGDFFNNY
jgi:hypothetical protein